MKDVHWGRTYESFGQNISIPTLLGPAFIRGLQRDNYVTACAKHYIGFKTQTNLKLKIIIFFLNNI
jgi:beta-glucosidase-like glycosyl hydrolase